MSFKSETADLAEVLTGPETDGIDLFDQVGRNRKTSPEAVISLGVLAIHGGILGLWPNHGVRGNTLRASLNFTLGITIISGLEVTVSIEVDVSILFGLEVNVEAVMSYLVEVFMENSFVFLTCVWCGVAFLRA